VDTECPRSDAIFASLRTKLIGKSLLVLGECESTNDVAEKAASEGAPNGFVVVSDEQRLGRGRYGRAWLSPKGGIWMTVLLKPPIVTRVLEGLTLIGALAVARGVSSVLGIKALVRWPNDVVVGQRKLAGILAEAKVHGNELSYVLLGVGVNVNFRSFSIEGARQQPISILDLVGVPIDRALLISSILLEVEQLLDRISTYGEQYVLELLKQMDASIGRHVIVELGQDSICQGIVDGYESLTKVSLIKEDGRHTTIDANAVISVAYVD
jgi:BirA family biotin operon repressor/biotin-[acetyl-CoA-carboxylase] ligase